MEQNLKDKIDACNERHLLLELIPECKELDDLLYLWKKYDSSEKFMSDGIMRNGHEEEWYNSKCRIMFLLKEGSENGGDVRDWLREDSKDENCIASRELETIKHKGKTTIFFPLAYILYGIEYLVKNKKVCRFNDIPYKAGYKHITIPFVYVEAKKVHGGGIANNKTIKTYVQDSGHKKLLEKEIQLLNPTIIVCFDNGACGLEKTVRELIKKEKMSVEVITAYHPCAWTKSLEAMYYRVMDSLNPFNKYDEEKNLLNTSFKTSIEMLARKHGLNCKYTPGNWCKQYEGQFSFYKPEWKHFCICFEFMGDNLTNFNYGIRYKDDSELDQEKKTKEDIAKKLGGTTSQWYASYKPFDPKDWNNNDVLDRLRNDAMTPLIGDKIDSLLKQLEGICL